MHVFIYFASAAVAQEFIVYSYASRVHFFMLACAWNLGMLRTTGNSGALPDLRLGLY